MVGVRLGSANALWSRFTVIRCDVCLGRRFYRTSALLLRQKALSVEKSVSILKLSSNPTFKELREKYIDQAKIYHPDSGGVSADSVKFNQLQEAYKVVHSYLRSQDESVDEEEDYDDTGVDEHVAPQHRQFLNYGGFGYGPPSKREKIYQKHKVLKAVEKISNHKVKQQAESSLDGKSLTVKQKKFVKRSKVTNAIERLVEDMIQESMAKGDFENLSGKGKPLPSKTKYCPFIDINQHNLNQILVNNGVLPEFVALEKEIKFLLSDAKATLYQERVKLGPEPLNDYNQRKWSRLVMDFSEDIKSINKKISNYNLVVPLLRLQKVHIQPERELKKVSDRYEQYERELAITQETQRLTEAEGNSETFMWSFVSQITEKVLNRLIKPSVTKD